MMELSEILRNASGCDGASSSDVEAAPVDSAEVDELIEAWLEERGRCIESTLMLDRVSRLLVRIIGERLLTPKTLREVRRVLRAIEEIRPDLSPTSDD